MRDDLGGESAEQLGRVVTALSARDPYGTVFIEAGRRFTDVHFGMLGPIVMLQQTARAAIDMLWACKNAIGGSPWRLHVVGEQARFGHMDTLLPSGVQYAQLATSIAYHAALRFWGSALVPQVSVDFAFEAPPDAVRAEYQRLFGDRVRFDARHTGLSFPAALLDHERLGADRALAARMRELALSFCARDGSANTWSWRVENALRASNAYELRGLPAVAKALAVSTRTLRRRLSEEGSTFSDLAMRVRRERAVQLLLETDASFTSIAQLAGYADPNSLRRSFVKTFGCTPRQVRQNGLRGYSAKASSGAALQEVGG